MPMGTMAGQDNKLADGDCDGKGTPEIENHTQTKFKEDKEPSEGEDNKEKNLKRQDDRHRFGLFGINLISTFLFAGAAFGWGPMQLLLEENETFLKMCLLRESATSGNNTTSSSSTTSEGDCYDDQETILMIMGLIIPLMTILSPLFGWIQDKIGPKRFAYTQAVLIIVAYILVCLGVKYHSAEIVLLFLGYSIIGMCTSFQNILIVQVGLYFEGHMISRVIFILNAVFDSGTLAWLLFWYIQKWTNISSFDTVCVLLGLAFFVYGLSVYFWTYAVPAASSESETKDEDDLPEECTVSRRPSSMYSTLELRMSSAEIDGTIKKNKERHSQRFSTSVEPRSSRASRTTTTPTMEHTNEEDKYVLVADRDPKAQLTSKPFLLIVAFFGLNVGCNWNSITQKDFLVSLGDDEHGNLYLSIFTLIAPLSILGAPLVDKLLLNFGWIITFQTLNGLSILYQIIKISSNDLNVQIVSFVIFSFYRSLLFGITFSFLPTLIGRNAIGQATGTMLFALGIMGVPGIFLVPIVVENGSFFITNLFFLVLAVVCIIIIQMLGKCLELENEAKAKKLEAQNNVNVDMTQLASVLDEYYSDSDEEEKGERSKEKEIQDD